jgi:cell division protein FtsQ
MTRQAANKDTAVKGTRRSTPRPVSAEQYRRRRLAAALAALLLLVGLGLTGRVLLYDLGLADVTEVQVTGATGIPVHDILAAAAVTPGGPLAAVDLTGTAGRVARLPAVESVRVGRTWPHTVSVDITERVPVAVTTTTDGPALVDRLGVVYPGGPVPGLPVMTVALPGTDDPSTLAAVAVLTTLPDPIRTQVTTVDVTIAGPGVPAQVTLGLNEGRKIRWGAPDRAQEKAAVLVPLLQQGGSTYDVTSPELPTVRP